MALFASLSFGFNVIGLAILVHIIIMIQERVRWFTSASPHSAGKKSIAILVLGDLGRSPRMQRHGQSILNHLNEETEVHFIGFDESPMSASLRNNQRVKVHHISSIRKRYLLGDNPISFLLYALLKICSEICSLWYILILSSNIPSPLTTVIMQNPPSVPVVIIGYFCSLIRGCVFVIDWHNFGFSILAMKQSGIWSKMYMLIERYIGKRADVHLTVTQNMKQFLCSEWRFNSENIFVLYDRATRKFLERKINDKDDAALWKDIGCHFSDFENLHDAKGDDLWIISSTSWTVDEDLNMLLDDNVLTQIDDKIQDRDRKIVLFITGKDEGKLKEKFERKLKKQSMSKITVIPLWLESHGNYVHLLKWCDIGLCFHLSSSGLDLPMKVVDMFGVGIPVIAIDFSQEEMEKVMGISTRGTIKTALNELVRHNENGLVFRTSSELVESVMRIYEDRDGDIARFKTKIEEFRSHRWDDEWEKVMRLTDAFFFDESEDNSETESQDES